LLIVAVGHGGGDHGHVDHGHAPIIMVAMGVAMFMAIGPRESEVFSNSNCRVYEIRES